MPEWSEVAIDYDAGLDIHDNVTGRNYTEEEARAAPPEIRRRLTMKPRKIGCFVMTLAECDECLRKRGLL